MDLEGTGPREGLATVGTRVGFLFRVRSDVDVQVPETCLCNLPLSMVIHHPEVAKRCDPQCEWPEHFTHGPCMKLLPQY